MFASDLKHTNSSLEEKLRRLNSLGHGKSIALSLRPPYLKLLQAFGNPQTKMPPVIHVAGTNGKGSIIATLKAILEASGYKVHAYTSPHLRAFNERIYVAGKTITDAALEKLIDEALILNAGKDITFFEITTAMAFAAFARTPADILLLETGMGGRLDCTNVIEHPAATIISTIGLDHVEHLGDSPVKIAAEKAGIMKRGVSCVIASQSEKSVMEVFEQTGARLDAPLYRAGAQWFSETKNGKLHFVFKSVPESVERILPAPNLKGAHQIANAGAALAALEVIAPRFPVTQEAIEKGLQNIQWPARLQDVTDAFRTIITPGWEIWLDGAHNEDAARMLSTEAAAWQAKDGKSLHLVLGMMDHKNPAAFVQPLLQHLESLSLVDIPGEPRSLKASHIKDLIDTDASVHKDFKDAIQAITRTSGKAGRILIAGSLYLAGHVLKTAAATGHTKAHAA